MVDTKKAVRLSFVIGLVLAALYFLWLVRSGLYPFILALLLTYLLNPAVCYLEQKGFSRLLAIIFIYIILFAVLVLGGSWLVPLLMKDLESFARDLPQIMSKSEELIYLLQNQYQNSALPYSMRVAIDNSLMSFERDIQLVITDVANGIVNLMSHSVGLAITPILAFYLLHDWREIREQLLTMLPGHWRHETVLIAKDIDKVLNGVIRGQITVAIIVGILVSSGLYFLKVPFALLIGILAGLLDIIPYFGAVIGATPAVTIALLESPWLAVKVALLFLVIHQLEGTIIGPKILGESVGLHPLSVIFFLFAGGELWGLIGMLLGVPLAAVAKVIIKHCIKLLV
ncbi:MAG TPA: AI-2E family transporter [Methylomusa anaerophila]|uniref:AI-2 transport protein TqsA n=1 Tax=Methylomusa anaerophila TaxID=1930071 RepID=A0A348AP93_9FIRM|nr:AI-2E family transporter [Methylomusa anaerophila]BBB92891.1 AI-2 transport protein TqsA [Methylomusa anaerophila]HML87273.1 AI-2E family transporter [Methylomusa anaerophila]